MQTETIGFIMKSGQDSGGMQFKYATYALSTELSFTNHFYRVNFQRGQQ